MTTYSTIRAQDLTSTDPQRGIILDVRTKMEHAEKCMSLQHVNVPLDELQPDTLMNAHGLNKDSSVYILCRSGKRAAMAAEKFAKAGYHNVSVVEGGIEACEGCGHPIEGSALLGIKITGPISLERQVRIAAGLFTAIGAALGLFIDPLFSLIPLFVGSGLVFAGITDRCGMALILTKAPWNRIDANA
jgi:rhodanese-related sulfurtransferase